MHFPAWVDGCELVEYVSPPQSPAQKVIQRQSAIPFPSLFLFPAGRTFAFQRIGDGADAASEHFAPACQLTLSVSLDRFPWRMHGLVSFVSLMVPSEGIAILLGFGLPIAFFLFAISRGV